MSMKKSNRTWRRPPVEWDKHDKMRSAILKRKAVDEEDGKRARARWEQRKREKHDNQAREVQQDKLTAEERQAEIKVLTDKLEVPSPSSLPQYLASSRCLHLPHSTYVAHAR